ncbi:MAG: thioredoxin family protein [Bacteroidales bacterium]|nr:thioredoxin family protein [Bacteroidales bacterium]
MKKVFTGILALFIASTIFSQESFIKEDWEKAVALSKKTGKILFVDYYTDWCGWCKVMDKQTFNDSIVKPIMEENFVLLKIDAEKGVGPKLAKKYRVSAFPSFMFYSADGKVIKKIMGFQKAEEFIKTMEDVKKLNEAKTYYEGISTNLDLKYPKFYDDSFLDKESRPKLDIEEVNKYLLNQKDFNSEIVFAVLSRFPTSDEVNKKFLAQKDELSKLFGKEDVEQKNSQILNAKYSEVLKSLDEKLLEELLSFIEENLPEKKENYFLAINTGFFEKKSDWKKYSEIIDAQIRDNKLEPQQINQYSWNIYEKSEDSSVLKKAVDWMKNLCDTNPEWMFIDTYASLLYKTANYPEAKIQAEKAIKLGSDSGENVEETKILLEKILKEIK